MPQQTPAKNAKPYYDRFLKQFPDLKLLTNAWEKDVLVLCSSQGC